jgi:hypothetical protein
MDDYDYDFLGDSYYEPSVTTTNYGNPYDYEPTYDGGTGNPYDYETSTNPFLGPTTTYNPSSGTYTQVFDDGSTLVTDGAGNVVRSTNATDGPGISDSIAKIFGSIGANAGKLLTGMFKKPNGETDWAKVATLGGGLMGLLGSGGGGSQPSGYQGKIPQYTATREQLPMTDTDRVPGSAGRRYFSDLTDATPPPPAPAPAPETPATPAAPAEPPPENSAAGGGLMQLAKGRYLRGHTDGMEDKLRTTIEGKDPAALSHGEFVVPADVVSHLGNGNSDAGAKRLYQMMDRIRQARTGTKQQGKQIQADKYLPS